MNRRSLFALALAPLVAPLLKLAPVRPVVVSTPVVVSAVPQFDMEKLKAWVMENQEGITRAIVDGIRKQEEESRRIFCDAVTRFDEVSRKYGKPI